MMLGNNRCHQIGKSLSGSDFRFAKRNLFLGKTDVHLLCEADLFFPNVIAVVGKYNTEDGVNDLKGLIHESIQVSHISGVFHGIENVRDQLSVGFFCVIVAGSFGDHAGGKAGSHIDCNVIDFTAQGCMVDEISVFKSKIVGAAFVGFPCVLVVFKDLAVAIGDFKHFFISLLL